MALARTCSECGNPLAGKAAQSKTCSDACRGRRSRRLRRARLDAEFEQEQPSAVQEVAAIVRRESPDVIHRVLRDELAPVVRDALTEDVLRAVQDLLGLTPKAVKCLQDDLESDDATIRQRAYTLVTKYTIGHPALLKAEDTDPNQQLVVHFNLPRPEDLPPDPYHEEAAESRECDMCHEHKPAADFEAGSERCRECFAEWREKIMQEFAS